jgi:hypothetical protein
LNVKEEELWLEKIDTSFVNFQPLPVEEIRPSEMRSSTDHVAVTTLQTCIWEVPGSDLI